MCNSPAYQKAKAPYQYRQLASDDETRVLNIISVFGNTIECRLDTLSIPSKPAEKSKEKYVALSYCWGDESEDESILIDGQIFKVRPNLLAALKAVNSFLVRTGAAEKFVWIDAICINQCDDEEKSVQVQRMHHIYRHAERVLVWLGEEYDNSARVFTVLRLYEQLLEIVEDIEAIMCPGFIGKWQAQFTTLRKHGRTQTEKEELHAHYFSEWTKERFDRLQHFFHQTKEYRVSPNIFPIIARCDWMRDALRMISLSADVMPPYFSPRERKAFLSDQAFVDGAVSLVNRPWFSRLWTYQEIVLAKSGIVLCGKDSIDWGTLQCFRLIVNDIEYGPLSSIKTHYLILGAERALTSPSARGFDIDVERGHDTFLKVVMNLSCRQTGDARDYFYGVAGMIVEQQRSRMTIDYRLPVASVFRAATKMLCEPRDPMKKADARRWCKLKEFYGRSYTSKPRVSGLPTWCIDFSNRGGIRWESHEFSGFSEKACTILQGRKYSRKLLAEASRVGSFSLTSTRRTPGLYQRVKYDSCGRKTIDDVPIDDLAKYTPSATKGNKAKTTVPQAGKVAFDNAGRMSIAGFTLDIVQASTSKAANENMLDAMYMETLPATRSFNLRSFFDHIYNEDNRKWFRDITDVFNLDKWQTDKIAQTWLMNYAGQGDILEEKGRLFEEIRAAHDIIEKSGRSPWEAMTHRHPLRKDEYLGLFGEPPAPVDRDLNKDKVAVTELTGSLSIQITEISSTGEDMGLLWSTEDLETHLDSSEGYETDSGDDLSSVGFVSIDAHLENTIAEHFEKVFQMEAGGFKQAYLSNLTDESDPYAFQKLFEEIGKRLEDVKKQLDSNTHSDVDPDRQKDILIADIRYRRMSELPLVTKLSHLFIPVAKIEGRLRARYFFKTKAGRIGWSMQPTQPGDRICYLDGANYPHIISSDGRRHLTWGAVEGMMGDEILKYVDGRDHWDDFRFE
ncbi:heterokaryon incompatibility protein-domain-containing protein [Hypoxylon rubiginosum]|uniref:Heterokaryon incompatibility protein-domain-containing protein n=1 Tax=Hypoxylon rubiginosum TaxID=110542 RepID=A0ACC0D611_9PEZI|nr:heterokaryon incompatibility protein-domain-containing protein [Hypoxylon rubiginosum]